MAKPVRRTAFSRACDRVAARTTRTITTGLQTSLIVLSGTGVVAAALVARLYQYVFSRPRRLPPPVLNTSACQHFVDRCRYAAGLVIQRHWPSVPLQVFRCIGHHDREAGEL